MLVEKFLRRCRKQKPHAGMGSSGGHLFSLEGWELAVAQVDGCHRVFLDPLRLKHEADYIGM